VKRRAFITLIGGAAAWPLAAWAQLIAAFRQSLAEAGYVDGQNVAVQYQWAEGHNDGLPAMAAEFVRRQVAVLVAAGGDSTVRAAKAATSRIPIVFAAGGDPVASGLVSNLARPEANVTGVSFFTTTLGPKRLELLRELAPNAATVAIMVHPASAGDAAEVRDAVAALGLSLRVLTAANDQEIDSGFPTLARDRVQALLIISTSFVALRARVRARHGVLVGGEEMKGLVN
jgi:ABC-type uncharacterized transport system substrate-binding protein